MLFRSQVPSIPSTYGVGTRDQFPGRGYINQPAYMPNMPTQNELWNISQYQPQQQMQDVYIGKAMSMPVPMPYNPYAWVKR